MSKQKKIAPSILSADFWKLGEDIELIDNAGAHVVHVDVMDGHFVPVITIGPLIVRALKARTKMPLDVHLMIENPGSHIDDFIDAGADYLTIHYEASTHLHREIQQIKAAGVKAGVSLNPHTPLNVLEDIIHDLDLILIMSVNPGFGGQSFIPHTINKLKELKQILKDKNLEHIEVEVDGGVKLNNIAEIAEAGADILVAGSAIYKAEDPTATIKEMNEILSKLD
jgi:ribulose-phosphate 3-epimerase